MTKRHFVFPLLVFCLLGAGRTFALDDKTPTAKPTAANEGVDKDAARRDLKDLLKLVSNFETFTKANKSFDDSIPVSPLCRPRVGTSNQFAECLSLALATQQSQIVAQIGAGGYERLNNLASGIPKVGGAKLAADEVGDGDDFWKAVLDRLVISKPAEGAKREDIMAYFIFVKLVTAELKSTAAGSNYIAEAERLGHAYVDYQIDLDILFRGIEKKLSDSAAQASPGEIVKPVAQLMAIAGMLSASKELEDLTHSILVKSIDLLAERFSFTRAYVLHTFYDELSGSTAGNSNLVTSRGMRFAVALVFQEFKNCPVEEGTLREMTTIFCAPVRYFSYYTMGSPRRDLAKLFAGIVSQDEGLKSTVEKTEAFKAIVLFATRALENDANLATELRLQPFR